MENASLLIDRLRAYRLSWDYTDIKINDTIFR